MYRFVGVCVLCALVCAPVCATECNSGEYAQGENCATCPTTYPYSIPNAASINDCYLITNPGEFVNAPGATPVKCAENHYCLGNVPVSYDMRRYVKADYIQSTGTQYIDTGIILGSDIDTKMVFETGYVPDKADVALFGARNNGLNYWLNGYNNNIYIRYNNYAPIQIHWGLITPNEKSILEIKNGNWVFNEKELYTNSETFDVGLNGYLFAFNSSDELWPHPSLKIFSFVQWRNGDLVLDLIPVYDLKTGQYGMWDNVGGRFLGNIGTGEFLGGIPSSKLDIFENGSIDCTTATDGVAPYSPASSDDIMDCGHVLHLGDNRKLYLRGEKRTSPSLAVQIKNYVFYADTSPDTHGVLRTEYKGQKLSVYNMDADD